MAAAVEATAGGADAEFAVQLPRRNYQVIACEILGDMGERLQQEYPANFTYHETSWGRFPDGTDNIKVGGFTPSNQLRGENVLFLASFHNNDVLVRQLHVIIMLLESMISSMTIVLPFYPTATMERVTEEGVVATASTLARIFNTLPSCGPPSCLMVYDLHTLQNRFYMSGHTVAQLETAIPLLKCAFAQRPQRGKARIDCIAFPDDGAAKRFGKMFDEFPLPVTCGKHRIGDQRVVRIMDGDPAGKNVLIIDDLVQSGGTLYECAAALKAAGAASVSAYCTHGIFPNEAWRRFTTGGDRCVFEDFYLTNSVMPTIRQLPTNDVFVIIDLLPKIVNDLL